MAIKKPTFINSIRITVPFKKIFSRLGYRKHFTELPDSQRAKIETTIETAFGFCSFSGSYKRFAIAERDKNRVLLDIPSGDGLEFISSDFSSFLQDSSGIYLFAVTAGREITLRRDTFIKEEKAFEALIYDAVGSESADEAASWLNKYLASLLTKEGRMLTKRRYSPGYGNLGLENQKSFITHLQLEKIGVQLTDSFLLLPEKSVTAAAGIIG